MSTDGDSESTDDEDDDDEDDEEDDDEEDEDEEMEEEIDVGEKDAGAASKGMLDPAAAANTLEAKDQTMQNNIETNLESTNMPAYMGAQPMLENLNGQHLMDQTRPDDTSERDKEQTIKEFETLEGFKIKEEPKDEETKTEMELKKERKLKKKRKQHQDKNNDIHKKKKIKHESKTMNKPKAKTISEEEDDSSNADTKVGPERKLANMRRNIREVMSENQLDEETLNAQRQEMERLRRVQEQQRIIREVSIRFLFHI